MGMNGIIFDVKRYAIHDGPGIRTTVFLKGCPLDCWWCHNPEGRKTDPECFSRDKTPDCITGREISVDDIMREVCRDIVFYDQSGGGVTFSGGEPMMQIEFLYELLIACRREGIHTALDTCGYAPSGDFERIAGLVDLFLYDIKLMNDDLHRKYTGVSNHLILDNLNRLSGNGNRIVARLPLIPDVTDTDENVIAIADFMAKNKTLREVSLLPYNKLGHDKLRRFHLPDRLGIPREQSPGRVKRLTELFHERGIAVGTGGEPA